jgi:flagellar basal-body rod modification protein FlgD
MAVSAASLLSTSTTTDSTDASKKARTVGGTMGKDQFLQLLVTQLKYQDPLKPMDDTAFVSQMAQFSALEQMQNLNTSYSATKAFSLIGKTVSANYTSETGELVDVTGVVDKVRIDSGNALVSVNGKEIPIDKISEVSNVYNTSMTELMGLIGKKVDGNIIDASGNTAAVAGIVASIKKVDGKDNVSLNNVILNNVEVVIPKGSVQYIEDYLKNNFDKTISVKVTDLLGRKTEITGNLYDYAKGSDGSFNVMLSGVNVPVEQIDGLSSGG